MWCVCTARTHFVKAVLLRPSYPAHCMGMMGDSLKLWAIQ
ncbi:hypothetical protein ApDm4_0390 [Acetobacter pomorum]|nr:hypothetical protein ApDm4_0390 [Acetobacter pomorum]